jgi:hypothetical protein
MNAQLRLHEFVDERRPLVDGDSLEIERATK